MAAAVDTDQQMLSIINDPKNFDKSFLIKSDEQAARLFKPPEFLPPYPVKMSPRYAAKETAEWVREWLLSLKVKDVLDDKMLENLVSMDTPRLAAVFHPTAGEWGFRWASKYLIMLFVIDDIVDDSFVGKDKSLTLSLLLDIHLVMMWSFPDDPMLRRVLVPVFDVLEDGPDRQGKIDSFEGVLAEARTHSGNRKVYPGPLSIAGNVFRDVWADAMSNSSSPEASMLLVAQKTQDWMLGVIMETRYKQGRTAPDCVDDIIQIRKRSAAIDASLLIAEVILENPLRSPASWIYSPEMQRMLECNNDIVTWHNDIWSFKREALQYGHMMNLVLAVSIQNRVTYDEAGQIVGQMLNQRLIDLEAAAADLERATPPDLQPNFVFYREECRNFAAGIVYWHGCSPRYNQI